MELAPTKTRQCNDDTALVMPSIRAPDGGAGTDKDKAAQ